MSKFSVSTSSLLRLPNSEFPHCFFIKGFRVVVFLGYFLNLSTIRIHTVFIFKIALVTIFISVNSSYKSKGIKISYIIYDDIVNNEFISCSITHF